MGFYMLFSSTSTAYRQLPFSYDSCVFSGEIDRCLKKVTEGVETFEDIWQKVLAKLQVKREVLTFMIVMLFSAR